MLSIKLKSECLGNKLAYLSCKIMPNNSGKFNLVQIIPFLNFIIKGSAVEVQKAFKFGVLSTEYNIIFPANQLFNSNSKVKFHEVSIKIKCEHFLISTEIII